MKPDGESGSDPFRKHSFGTAGLGAINIDLSVTLSAFFYLSGMNCSKKREFWLHVSANFELV